MHKTILSMLLCLGLLAACSKKEPTVTWPELQTLDLVVESAEAKVKAGVDAETRAKFAAEISDLSQRLLDSDVPKNVRSPDRVALRLRELQDLRESLVQTDALTDAHLLAFHPVVESLMDAAGMPHVH